MRTLTTAPPAIETLADLWDRLGQVPLDRIRFHPAPGTATEADVLPCPNGEKRLRELVDGVLVEKQMGFYESLLASILCDFFWSFLAQYDLCQIPLLVFDAVQEEIIQWIEPENTRPSFGV